MMAHSYPPDVNWHSDIPSCAVPDMLEDTVRQWGHRPAFDFLGRKYTWREIGHQVDLLARGLQDMGVQKNTRVGLLLPNCPLFLIAYYAIIRCSGIVIACNPLYAPKELEYQVRDSGMEIMITADLSLLMNKAFPLVEEKNLKKLIVADFSAMLPFPKNILFKMVKKKDLALIPPHPGIISLSMLMDNPGHPDPVAFKPDEDIAVLQYTGGTTGTPKAAMLTHSNIVANAEQCRLWFHAVRPGQEKMVGVLPFFHVFAMTAVMNMSVRLGFEIIALPKFDLDQTLSIIHRKKPHYFPAVPAIYNAINNHPRRSSYDLTSLRYCISGGAPLPVEVKKRFEHTTGCVVVEGYGLTETSPVVCVNPIVGENRAGSIGLPMPGTELKLVDLETRKTEVKGAEERGELCIRGPQVMKGYWNRSEETGSVLRDGWLHTGDVAKIDADGYVYIVDRIKDMIITNGYNVYPRNVEEAIYKHPAIEECIVAGLPDADRGEIVKAWIRLKPGFSLAEEDLKTFLKDHISPMEIPRRFSFQTEPLPRTMIGKLSRKDIVAKDLEKA